MKKLFLALFALLPLALAHGSGAPFVPPVPKPVTNTTALSFTVNQPAYTTSYPHVGYQVGENKVTVTKTAFSEVTSASYLPAGSGSIAAFAVTDATTGSISITPTAVGTTTLTVLVEVPTTYNGGYINVADTFIYNITVSPITSTQAITMNVDQATVIPTPTAESSYTITNDGVADGNWTVSKSTSPMGVSVMTHMLGTDVLHVFDGKGDEYDYTLTTTLWTPTAGQVELSDVSTSQPEYQTLIAGRAAAETYASALPFWGSAVRREWPGGMFDNSTYRVSRAADFSYNTMDNVTVLEATFCNEIALYNATTGDGVGPTSSGSTGVAYDPDHGTVYGNPSGTAQILPNSAAMAITGSGGTLEVYNGRGDLGFSRVTGTNLTVIGVTTDDDAGFASSWAGYEISYLEEGSLPSEQPPAGTITASKSQVLTKGQVTISWALE